MCNGYEVTTTVEVDPKRVQDMIVGAFEGGSNYWLGDGRVELVQPTYDELGGREEKVVWYGRETANVFALPDFKITIDVPDDAVHMIGREDVVKGLSIMANSHNRHFRDLLDETDDAETADVFLQLVLFGEITYG